MKSQMATFLAVFKQPQAFLRDITYSAKRLEYDGGIDRTLCLCVEVIMNHISHLSTFLFHFMMPDDAPEAGLTGARSVTIISSL